MTYCVDIYVRKGQRLAGHEMSYVARSQTGVQSDMATGITCWPGSDGASSTFPANDIIQEWAGNNVTVKVKSNRFNAILLKTVLFLSCWCARVGVYETDTQTS